jgi:hypothetical protein
MVGYLQTAREQTKERAVGALRQRANLQEGAIMGLVMSDLEGEMSDAERASRKEWIDRTKSNDIWAKKIFKKVGIMMTGHQGNRAFMKACLETHQKLGFWITLAYDNFIDPTWSEDTFKCECGNKTLYDKFMPPKDIMDKVDMFLMPHHQVWGGVLYPWFWLMKWGTDVMSQFEYIYSVNADFILEKPEGFPKLLEYMGDYDILSYGPNSDTSVSTCFIAKTLALKKIMQHFQDHFIPWDVYEKDTQEFGNAESRFCRAIKDCNLTLAPVEPPFNEQMHEPGHGTWYDLVGFRHIHGELGYAYRYKKLPPPSKYLDERYAAGNDMKWIKKYEETKDPKVLENWWRG